MHWNTQVKRLLILWFQPSRLIPRGVENVDFRLSFPFAYITATVEPIIMVYIPLERADLEVFTMVKFIIIGLMPAEILAFKITPKHFYSFLSHCTYYSCTD